MKRRYILALLCLPLIACAQMSITTLESASQTVPSDTLRATFHFTEENKNTNGQGQHQQKRLQELDAVVPHNFFAGQNTHVVKGIECDHEREQADVKRECGIADV